jgi:hypothetical protein
MKYYTFYRENNNFNDLLKDPIVKKIVDIKIRWTNYLMIGIESYSNGNDQNFSYITLKYGDDMVDSLCKDFTPMPNVDYVPDKNTNKFNKSIT